MGRTVAHTLQYRVSVGRTVVLGVLLDSDVEEGGVKPLKSNGDICYGVQHYLCIQVLDQVVVEAGGGREGGREREGT